MRASPHVLVCSFWLPGSVLVAPAQEGLPEARVLPDPNARPAGGQSGSITLAKVSSKPNQITDEDAWWEANGLRKPVVYMRFPALEHGC